MIVKNKKTSSLIRQWDKHVKSHQKQQGPDWLSTLRKQSVCRFTELGIPTVKDEEWKYTNLTSLANHTFELSQESKLVEVDAFKEYCSDQEINIVFVNGILSAELSNLDRAPRGMTICTLQEAIVNKAPRIEELLTAYDIADETAFVALNEALNDAGTYISVDENAICRELIHIIHVTSAGNKETITLPRTLITLGQSSEATILESHIAFNDEITYFTNALTDIFLGENATLHYCKSQKESMKAFHIGRTRVRQDRHSNYDGFSFMAGGLLTRNELDIALNGEGADAILHALYSAHDNQHMDNHTSVDHRVPNCTSNQLYKGILNNAARAVFNGKVFVRPIAQQTNSYQLNKNLLLGKDCRVDTKPQLEIFADDVKCTHGATIGQLNEDEMFYLQTRCIPKKMAIKMLAHGFVNDLFNTIKSDSIHQKLNILMKPSFEAL